MNNQPNGYLDLLLAEDGPDLYFPANFSIERELDRVKHLAALLEEELGMSCRVDSPSNYQDDSLFTKISIAIEQTSRKPATIYISSFDNLVTLHGDLPEGKNAVVVLILEKCGYRFVPLKSLFEDYNGNYDVHKGRRWLDVYFSEWY